MHLAIIPARSGSKGLANKNIRLLNGVPLMAYSIKAAIDSNMFDEIMVSTDSEEYAGIARHYGAQVPFMRSDETASDTAGSWEMVREVLNNYRNIDRKFDTVCLLQPTSPLRKAEDIVDSYSFFNAKEADAVTSVCETEHTPLWTMRLPDTLSLMDFRKQAANCRRRQELDTYYRINGAIYIRKIRYGQDDVYLSDRNEYAYIMPTERSIDIDTETDFYIAEVLMEKIENDMEMRR